MTVYANIKSGAGAMAANNAYPRRSISLTQCGNIPKTSSANVWSARQPQLLRCIIQMKKFHTLAANVVNRGQDFSFQILTGGELANANASAESAAQAQKHYKNEGSGNAYNAKSGTTKPSSVCGRKLDRIHTPTIRDAAIDVIL